MDSKWEKFLAPFLGKRCTVTAKVGYCGESFTPDVFDSRKHERFVKSYVSGVLDSWEYTEEQFGKKSGELVMFAANTNGDMVDAVLFYDRNTGQVYKYEEADYSDTGLKLDKLGLKAKGPTPKGVLG
jgi:hypothetical protein